MNSGGWIRQRGLQVTLLLVFILIVWSVQLFILMMALDAYLGHEDGLLWPAAITSLLLAVVTVWLVRKLPPAARAADRSDAPPVKEGQR